MGRKQGAESRVVRSRPSRIVEAASSFFLRHIIARTKGADHWHKTRPDEVVVEPLSASDIDEVCRVRDMRLGRDVSVKVLPGIEGPRNKSQDLRAPRKRPMRVGRVSNMNGFYRYQLKERIS